MLQMSAFCNFLSLYFSFGGVGGVWFPSEVINVMEEISPSWQWCDSEGEIFADYPGNATLQKQPSVFMMLMELSALGN
jgi:hypothetical protein